MKLWSRIEWSKIKKEYILIAAVIGIVLMFAAKMGSDAQTAVSTGDESKSSIFHLGEDSNDASDVSAYLSYMKESMTLCLNQMKGVGKAEVFLTPAASADGFYGTEKVPEIQGVLIVAEGADDPLIVKDITEACEALFSLSMHKIKVVKMKEENQ